MPGYWWQCDKDGQHRLDEFSDARGVPLVMFMYLLACSDWDQTQLTPSCRECASGSMRITYEFPGRDEPSQLAVHRIIGLSAYRPDYLPMMWETVDVRNNEHWCDCKYVGWSLSGGLRAKGLARPAVFKRRDLRALFELYRRVAGIDDCFP